MAALHIAHRQRVTRLYRRCLKHLLSWAIDRSVWREEAVKLRARFDEHRNESNARKAVELVEEAEREFEKHKHPDPYISPEAPDGSKWERNMPVPPQALVMTPDEEKWYKEASEW